MDQVWAEKYLKVFGGTLDECERIWVRSCNEGIRWSYLGASDYPEGWRQLEDPPEVFSYRGDPVWNYPTISVVGSRTPMRDTCLWMQLELPRFLALQPAAVVSGGARGVDQWAHRICMDSGRPTVCVFPSGLLSLYPHGFEAFAQRILDTGGALVSTFPLEQEMRKRFFIERNRWIAGMSPLTFVVEANRRSGSSMTAKKATEDQRDICTLPVFPRSYQGLANLDLIVNDKAHMIRDHRDLIEVFKKDKYRFMSKTGAEISKPQPEK